MTPIRLYITILLLGLLFLGCLGEVDHTNPLDPDYPGFDSVGTIEGITTRYYPPFTAVPGARVELDLGMYAVISGPDGRFRFRDVPVREYFVSASKTGFKATGDTVMVELGASIDTISIRLDGLPHFSTEDLRTAHISRWFPTEDLYQIEAVVMVEDPDGLGDVDTVWFEIPGRGYEHALNETSVAGRYEVILPSEALPGKNLYALQGEEFVFLVRDQVGYVTESDPQHILRIIDYTPVALAPQGQEIVASTTPSLTWEDAALPYDYTYRVQVVRDQANVRTVVETGAGIPPESLSYAVEMPLPAGTYFWTISVVDELGNWSRSKEAGFIVE